MRSRFWTTADQITRSTRVTAADRQDDAVRDAIAREVVQRRAFEMEENLRSTWTST